MYAKNKDKDYYQIDATIDKKIIGRSELPLSVEIKDQGFLNFRKEKLNNINNYFNQVDLYFGFPEEVKGKMYQKKKNPIDIMLVIPSCLSLPYIISEKVKNILSQLVSDEEYHLEKIEIDGYDKYFYFLFIPYLETWKYVDFSNTIFYNRSNKEEIKFKDFNSYEENKKLERYAYKKLSLSGDLSTRKLINIPVAGIFYHHTIINAFIKENVVGFDIIEGGDFKVDLTFNTD
ncbi:hypothetical protein MKJ01_15970 [Chryseobacterium sp. SSA4.19]|uniref:hypothetical protein n=1 Tax=Chryseobacterium sp. SSA4.19 TaxID=2919915 RepID=UPI001F4D8E9F|nr:hypothetical protein [Chryseobacterium sp. SSA4.19]MCJ8155262.1 hypothetical protein [Chryseobacterium sp. SSA4.19]